MSLVLATERGEDAPTWREIVVGAVRSLGAEARLSEIYAALENHSKAAANRHWRAKIRQTVARTGLRRVGGSVWAV